MKRDASTRVEAARTLLFVPGTRPDRFDKALRSGADLVVLDLEDAVADADKATARQTVSTFLGTGAACAVRINAYGEPWHEDDVAMVRRRGTDAMVPKAQSAEELARITASLPGVQVIALVETAAGVMNARSLAEVDGVVRLALGTFDLAAELGVAPDDRDAMAAARGQLVLASASAGIARPVDGPTGAVDDESAVRADVEFAKRLGYSGKLCIHPRQVRAAAMALAPSQEEISWAVQVVEAAGAAAVAVVDGKMIDRPVVTRARRILAAQENQRKDGDV